MVYLKSTLVGMVTLFIATIGYIGIAMAVMLRKYPPPPGVEVAFDLRALFTSPSYWLLAIAAFAVGFYWQFHRV